MVPFGVKIFESPVLQWQYLLLINGHAQTPIGDNNGRVSPYLGVEIFDGNPPHPQRTHGNDDLLVGLLESLSGN